MLTVSGQRWLNGESRVISKTKLGVRILCETHNNLLSELDNCAISTFRDIDEVMAISDERGKMPRWKLWRKVERAIDAKLFERWLIKYLMGVCFEEPTSRWHPDGTPPHEPPLILLRALFGFESLQPPMGLYFLGGLGQQIHNEERVGIAAYLLPDTEFIAAGIINFRNFQFLIWLADLPIEQFNFAGLTGVQYGPGEQSLQYHLETITLTARGKKSAILHFEW